MKEKVLKDYFEGNLSSKELAADLKGSVTQTSHDVYSQKVESMNCEYQVELKHIIKLCDDALNGSLTPHELETIAFAIICSDNFDYDTDTVDGERIAEVLFNWDSPEINYELSLDNIRKFKHYLLTGENTLSIT